VRRAVDLLNDSFAETVSLDILAREARLSKYYFARRFNETTGFAPHQYQKLLRLQAARRYLENGDSVEEAADRSGFADGPHLARTFREHLGVSPGAWARAFRVTLRPWPSSAVSESVS
jgi:AraC-like DNA-binding protein